MRESGLIACAGGGTDLSWIGAPLSVCIYTRNKFELDLGRGFFWNINQDLCGGTDDSRGTGPLHWAQCDHRVPVAFAEQSSGNQPKPINLRFWQVLWGRHTKTSIFRLFTSVGRRCVNPARSRSFHNLQSEFILTRALYSRSKAQYIAARTYLSCWPPVCIKNRTRLKQILEAGRFIVDSMRSETGNILNELRRVWRVTNQLFSHLGAGKTGTHCGGNIADVISGCPDVDSFCHARNICGRHKFCVLDAWSVSENLQKHFLCPRGAQQCCRVLPRTGNIAGHNVAIEGDLGAEN